MYVPTRKLFHEDAYQTEFTARVLSCAASGEAWEVVLDQTCFYAENGGQPSDSGTLAGKQVLSVREEDDGTIIHTVAGALEGEVKGILDWARRLDQMEQHTAQHLLSGAFERLFNAETVSWHLGEENTTVDLGIESLSQEQVEAVEAECFRLIQMCRPVFTHVVDDEGIKKLPLRKPPKVSGEIRVVEILGYDWSACGGTHVRNSGDLGMLKIKAWEKNKKSMRVYFLAGRRAFADYAFLDRMTRDLCRSLSIAVSELPRWVDRAQEENNSLRKVLKTQQDKLFEIEATELLSTHSRRVGSARIVKQVFAGRSLEEVKLLAAKVASNPGAVAIFGTRGAIPQVIIQRALDIRFDAGTVLRQVLPLIDGRGGGSPVQAQGGGSRPEALETALDQAAHAVADLVAHT